MSRRGKSSKGLKNESGDPPAHESVLINTLKDVGDFSIDTLVAIGQKAQELLTTLAHEIADVRQKIEDTVWQAIQPRLAEISTKIMANVSILRAHGHTELANLLAGIITTSTQHTSAQTHVENGSTEQNQSTPILTQSV